MRFAASEMPPLSAASIDGHVHSVFRRVVNLRLDDGELLTLYANDDDRQPPGAISFAAPLDFDFSEHVTHRAAISCRAGILRIAATDISIDLRHARRRNHNSNAPSPIGTGFSSAWRAAWHTLMSADTSAGLIISLNGRRPRASLDAALAVRARQTVPRLLDAARTNDVAAAMAAAARLVGAGPGLTPSGDDFLAGFLVGARHAAQNDVQHAFVDTFGSRLATLYGESGDISRAYFSHAAAGRIAQPQAKLARSIAAGAPKNTIKPATVAAMHMGHSSGSDGTFGLLCGLAGWRAELVGMIAAGLNI